MIVLVDGDETWYETELFGHGPDGEPIYRLKHKDDPDKSCFYLSDDGKCTIHGRAPLICRQFSCVEAFEFYTRGERQQLVKDGLIDKRIWKAARDRIAERDGKK